MDKENKEDFSFGRSCDLKVPVTFRMLVIVSRKTVFPALTRCRSQLEGVRHPRLFTELIERPELRFHGVQSPFVQLLHCALRFPLVDDLSSTPSDLYVTCQLLADNKPLTIPFRTSYKAFKNSYTSVSCRDPTVCIFC